MRRHIATLLTAVALAASGSSLVSACSPANAASPPNEAAAASKAGKDPLLNGARVGIGWQKKALALLAAGPANEAWALVSQGGWADNGQVVVLASKDGKTTRLLLVNPAAKDYGTDRPLTTAELADFQAKVKGADALEDLNIEMLDGIIYEYLHAERGDDGKVAVLKRVYIKSPGTKQHPEHDALIAAFQGLRKKLQN